MCLFSFLLLVMTVGLKLQYYLFLEGSFAVAVIKRQIFVEYEAPFEVTVSLERYRGPLFRSEAAVGKFGMTC